MKDIIATSYPLLELLDRCFIHNGLDSAAPAQQESKVEFDIKTLLQRLRSFCSSE